MTPSVDWAKRGHELSATLDARHVVVVVGSDPSATAEVALGAAREQARYRRVAVADLIGEAPPLQALVTGDDPHGIVDSFLFGVSLNKIAQLVPESGELFILPSGAAPIDYEELLAHPRWRRLAAGFREVNALLLLVVPAQAARLRDLIDATDGAVIVGDIVPACLAVSQSLAWLRATRSVPPGLAIDSAVSAKSPIAVETPTAVETPVAATAPVAFEPVAVSVEAARATPRRDRRRMVAGGTGIVLALGLAGAALWFAYRPFASERPPRRGSKPADSPLAGRLQTDSVAAARADSVRRDSLAHAAAPPTATDSSLLLAPANATDSALASRWAVRLEQTNTKSGAILDLRGRFQTVPASTYGFDLRNPYFLLVAGAFPTREGAESLLVQLRARKLLAPGDGSVASLPYAFLVEADVPAAAVAAHLKPLVANGQPVYALRQSNGASHLYFGAYESPQHAALAAQTVRDAGLTPVLVYRIGRVF